MKWNEIIDEIERFNDLMDEVGVLRPAYGVVSKAAMVLNNVEEETSVIDIMMKEECFDKMCDDLWLAPRLYKNQNDHWHMKFYGSIRVFRGWKTRCCTKPKYNLINSRIYVQTPESLLEEGLIRHEGKRVIDVELLSRFINRADEDNIRCAKEEIDMIIGYYDESDFENKEEYIHFLVSQIFLTLYRFKEDGTMNRKEMSLVMDYVSDTYGFYKHSICINN